MLKHRKNHPKVVLFCFFDLFTKTEGSDELGIGIHIVSLEIAE